MLEWKEGAAAGGCNVCEWQQREGGRYTGVCVPVVPECLLLGGQRICDSLSPSHVVSTGGDVVELNRHSVESKIVFFDSNPPMNLSYLTRKKLLKICFTEFCVKS